METLRGTIVSVLSARFAQVALKQSPSQQVYVRDCIIDDNEACSYAVDILHRTWNMLALFFDLEVSLRTRLSEIFNDEHTEVRKLLEYLGVSVSSSVPSKISFD